MYEWCGEVTKGHINLDQADLSSEAAARAARAARSEQGDGPWAMDQPPFLNALRAFLVP